MEEEAPDPEGTESLLDQSSSITEPQETALTDQQSPPQTQIQTSPYQPIKLDYIPPNIDEIEELVESIINEKWRSLIENFGDMGIWKERARTEISSIKQELIRLENRFENLQRAIIGRITTYDENIREVGSEIKALEKVFEKIINPLTTNIKELDRITKQLKTK